MELESSNIELSDYGHESLLAIQNYLQKRAEDVSKELATIQSDLGKVAYALVTTVEQ